MNCRAHTFSRGASSAQILVISTNEGQVLPFSKINQKYGFGGRIFKDLNVASKKLEKVCRLDKIHI